MRAKTAEDRQLLELLDPVAEAHGFEIVRLRLMGGAVRRLQVMAEDPATGDFSIEQCAALSRACSQVLDAADPVGGEYLLEVSSPGVDRPLTRLKDFVTFAGHEARVELDRLAENRKRFKGVIAGIEPAPAPAPGGEADGPRVGIDLEGEEAAALVPFAWIAEAKLVLTDALMRRGAAMRAARLEPTPDSPESEAADIETTDEEED